MSSDREIQELHHPAPVPLRELASKEIPHEVHELPSPVPNAHGLRMQRSMSSIRSSQEDSEAVSPMVGPYYSNRDAVISEISLPEAGKKRAP